MNELLSNIKGDFTRIDIKNIIYIAFILLIAYLINKLIKSILTRLIRRSAEKMKTDPTSFIFLKNMVSFVIYTLAFFACLTQLGVEDIGTKLFASGGIAIAAIAFASQKTIANFMSGFMLMIFKPIRVGDYIQISDLMKGTVESITIWYTVIRDVENRRILIPNSTIADATIINSSINDERIQKTIEVGISYSSDIARAKEIFRRVIEADPLCLDMRTSKEKAEHVPKVVVRVVALADSSVNLRAYAWSDSNNSAFILQCNVLEKVKLEFDRAGIEIPYPYRTVVLKNDSDEESPQEEGDPMVLKNN